MRFETLFLLVQVFFVGCVLCSRGLAYGGLKECRKDERKNKTMRTKIIKDADYRQKSQSLSLPCSFIRNTPILRRTPSAGRELSVRSGLVRKLLYPLRAREYSMSAPSPLVLTRVKRSNK